MSGIVSCFSVIYLAILVLGEAVIILQLMNRLLIQAKIAPLSADSRPAAIDPPVAPQRVKKFSIPVMD